MHITISISLHSKFPVVSTRTSFSKRKSTSWTVSSSTNAIYHEMGFREDKLARASTTLLLPLLPCRGKISHRLKKIFVRWKYAWKRNGEFVKFYERDDRFGVDVIE